MNEKLDNIFLNYGNELIGMADWLDKAILMDTDYQIWYDRGLELHSMYIPDDSARGGAFSLPEESASAGRLMRNAGVMRIVKGKGLPFYNFVSGTIYRDDCAVTLLILRKNIGFDRRWFPGFQEYDRDKFINGPVVNCFEVKNERLVVFRICQAGSGL